LTEDNHEPINEVKEEDKSIGNKKVIRDAYRSSLPSNRRLPDNSDIKKSNPFWKV